MAKFIGFWAKFQDHGMEFLAPIEVKEAKEIIEQMEKAKQEQPKANLNAQEGL